MHTRSFIKMTSALTTAAIVAAAVVLVATLARSGEGLTDLSFGGRCLAHVVMIALIAAVGLAIRPSAKVLPRS